MDSGGRLLVATAFGLVVAGTTILVIGMTVTFVSTDLTFIGATASELEAVTDRLVPLVAHDRIGFGAGVLVGGLLIGAMAFFAEGRAARQVLVLAAVSAFGLAIAIHFAVGYTDFLHLAPAIGGAVSLLAGVALWRPDA